MFINNLVNFDLDNQERGLLLYLMQYIPYGNNYLRYRNGREISANSLASNSSLSRPTFFKIIKSLEEKNVLKTIHLKNKTRYYINPEIISRGYKPLKFVEELFNSGKQ